MEVRYSYRDAPTIKAFSESNAFIRGLMGPFRSGKSSGCVVEVVQRGLAQRPGPDGVRRSRWLVVRNTYPQLRDTTIKTFHQWFPPSHFGVWKSTEHDYIIKAFPNCEIEIMFRALDRPDHVSNLLSLEVTGAWVNEAREVPWTIIDAMQGRVGQYPAMRDGGPSWFGIFMDTNPPDNDSKWYRFFEEGNFEPSFAQLFKQPSGLADNAENVSNLASGRSYYVNLSQGKSAEWIKVYVKGEYGFVVDGMAVYPEYSDGVHCQPCSPIRGEPIYRGWDFGLTPACIFTQLKPTGQWVWFDELVSEDMGIDRFSDNLLEYSAEILPKATFVDVGDPAGEQRAQTDEKTCFEILQAKGIEIEGGLQSPQIRFESMRKPLNSMVVGQPKFLIDQRCKTARKGLQGGYYMRRMHTTAERYASQPEKNFYSHVMNAGEYVATRLFGTALRTSSRPAVESAAEDDLAFYSEMGSRNQGTGY